MAKSNKFSALSSALKGEAIPEQIEPDAQSEQPSVEPAAATPRRKVGKRSNPDYVQVGAYVPKTLDKDVKRLLVDESIDFSDLVTALLADWVSSKADKR
jgi:hypothetical protein